MLIATNCTTPMTKAELRRVYIAKERVNLRQSQLNELYDQVGELEKLSLSVRRNIRQAHRKHGGARWVLKLARIPIIKIGFDRQIFISINKIF